VTDRIAGQVAADVLRRGATRPPEVWRRIGVQRLGPREWMQHAYEEALDFACLKRLMQEYET
jgi:hypothetical protein